MSCFFNTATPAPEKTSTLSNIDVVNPSPGLRPTHHTSVCAAAVLEDWIYCMEWLYIYLSKIAICGLGGNTVMLAFEIKVQIH